ncbi:hypothetical protein Tco_0002732 [Tanacetum coccineum]
MVDNISLYLRNRLENYFSFDLMAQLETMFCKQAIEDLMQAIKSVKTSNIVNLTILGYLMGSVSLVNRRSNWQEFDSSLARIHKLMLDQWELKKKI